LRACTIARSEPSYGPIARASETSGSWRRQRGQRDSATLTLRHDGSGSPQVRQQGSVLGMMAVQQREQTAPAVG
jgi:hypothetical protein